jgi:hypothetical protein
MIVIGPTVEIVEAERLEFRVGDAQRSCGDSPCSVEGEDGNAQHDGAADLHPTLRS